MVKLLRHGERLGRARDRDDERPLAVRKRMEPQAGAGDQAEPSLGTAEQLAEVVARDVLDDLAPGARHRPVCEHDRDAEQEIARGTVAMAPRAGEAPGEAGAYRRVAGRVESEHLPLLGQPSIQY